MAARIGAHLIETDQPVALGRGPAPFDLFLAALATCAGVYALGFLQSRGLDNEGLMMRQRVELDPVSHALTAVHLELTVPPSFREKYRSAIVRAVDNCKVKKAIQAAPTFHVVLADATSSASLTAG